MCGIAGFNWNNRKLAKKMADSIRHRGPDGEGFYTDEEISLGHRRLKILDLTEKGQQPMVYKNLVIVFNGEIYNFQELKKQLKKMGHFFISKTDTEVILHAYHQWGKACISKFNGMWAFCIYDKKTKEFFLSRDRFGIKPLYYFFDGVKFIFASEIKAIKVHNLKLSINPKALNFYFYQKYINKNLAIYNNIFKLQPAQNLTFSLKRKTIKKNFYYFLSREIRRYKKTDLHNRVVKLKSLLSDTVEKRLIADVPVGCFLSGGIDSSLVAAIIASQRKNFKTFTIGFKQKTYNEVPYSKIAAKKIKTDHYYQYQEMDDNLIKKVLNKLDEPFGDPSIIPTFLLCQFTKKKVAVSLSGDGGDEVFGGYDTYFGYQLSKYIPHFLIKPANVLIHFLPPSEKKISLSFKIKRFLGRFTVNACQRHFEWMAVFIDKDRKKLLADNYIGTKKLINFSTEQKLLDLQIADIQNYLPEDILKKVDIASMLNSLEVRVPYLDYRIVPLVLSLPEKYRIRGLKTKWLLKKIAGSYLPKKIVNRKKRGFTVPISQWIKKSKLIKKYLLEEKYYRHNFLDKNYILNLYKGHIHNKKDNSRQLWLVFVFNYWFYSHC